MYIVEKLEKQRMLNEFSSCEIKCVAFVRMVYKNAKWDKRRSYRMIGIPFPEQRLVGFQIQEALPIENGRVLDGTVRLTRVAFNSFAIVILHNLFKYRSAAGFFFAGIYAILIK